MAVGESRSELLQWLNATLELNYRKIEECGSGAAFCQLIDCILGGVPMNKVKFGVLLEYDYRQNWKVLQAQFTKHNITKVIDVEKLMKCRLQDNLELLQWFKRLWSESRGFNDYDPVEKRNKSGKVSANNSIGSITPGKRRVVSGSTQSHVATSQNTSFQGNSSFQGSQSGSRSSSHSGPSAPTSSTSGPSHGSRNSGQFSNNVPKRKSITDTKTETSNQLSQAQNEVFQLSDEVLDLKLQTETLETERNFYFNKLREIEILIQNINELVERNDFEQLKELTVMDLSKKVQGILYLTEEGFQAGESERGDSFLDEESF